MRLTGSGATEIWKQLCVHTRAVKEAGMEFPPKDWADRDAWDCYFNAQLTAGRTASYPDFIVLRFLKFAHEKGGRIWFAGCGLDPYPITYAERGCKVFATDFATVAVRYQQGLAMAFQRKVRSPQTDGTFAVVQHDFTQCISDGRFDVVVNCCAFQGLSASAMSAAATHFYTALRPGGACIIETMNVQGIHRNLIEDSLIRGGFYIPFQKSERWYRETLDATGIVYGMVMGLPRIPAWNQYPPEYFNECAERDQQTLDSFRIEYERRQHEEAAEVNAITSHPDAKVAHVVYATG